MSFLDAIKTCFRKYVTFSGRASRSEFWYFILFLSILSTIIQTYVHSGSGSMSFRFGLYLTLGADQHWLTNVFTLAVSLPFLSAFARRLHDTGKPGYLAPLFLIAVAAVAYIVSQILPILVGIVIFLSGIVFGVYWLCRSSEAGINKYGPNPHEVSS